MSTNSDQLTPMTSEILDVLDIVEKTGVLSIANIRSARISAVNEVAAERGIDSRSVADKCWRQLNLPKIGDFDDLVWGWLNRGDSKLRDTIEENLPSTASTEDRIAVESFFTRKRSLGIWWVNQGTTWKQETEGGYVWAPQTNKAGIVVGHHQSVNRLKKGDIVLNHWDSAIRGVSVVTEDGKEGNRPSDLPSETWRSDGYIAEVNFNQLQTPIETQSIPVGWRIEEPHAFNSAGGTNQAYLVPLTEKFVSGLAHRFRENLPSEIISSMLKERLLRFMHLERLKPDFDETERDYKLEINRRIIDFFENTDSEDSVDKFKNIFKSPNNLVSWRAVVPITSQIESDGFSGLSDFGQSVREYPEYAHQHILTIDNWLVDLDVGTQPANRLRITSLFVSACAPNDHILVMATVFESIEEILGLETNSRAEVLDRYQHHLEFATSIRRELEDRGTPIRDMIDVQSLIYIASNNIESWTNDPYVAQVTPNQGELDMDTSPEISELAAATFMDVDQLEDLLEIIKGKRQIILEGPPGSGKTFVANKIARYLSGNQLEGDPDDRMAVVQFHQTYGYEDFVQGIRPLTGEDGQLRYELRPGVFRQLCEKAALDSTSNYVVLIDEINRGNISRILGELLYLLEYREESVRLAYSEADDGLFSIPSNVFLIGTMNTTDRSLTQIDYALRRRFYFYRLMPTEGDKAPVLERWADHQGLGGDEKESLLNLFVKLNQRLTEKLDEHFQVGHSYFMVDGIEKQSVKEHLFKWAIMPLLEEYFFNFPDRQAVLGSFTLESLSGDSE